ncbi:RNA polymerase sigma factor sigma-70 region 4 domain-containing protein [Kitasatospora fiedleri]|uniref:hypothetical protein n=1 Tax=Kitasatospora fiedleri TaxID=2991545 RepID=UPI00249BB321|nr:hypothetical protein [Kitasatospora fiedleri]
MLRFREDRGVEETSGVLRIGDSAVRTRTRRALVRLRAALGDDLDAPMGRPAPVPASRPPLPAPRSPLPLPSPLRRRFPEGGAHRATDDELTVALSQVLGDAAELTPNGTQAAEQRRERSSRESWRARNCRSSGSTSCRYYSRAGRSGRWAAHGRETATRTGWGQC